MVSRRFDLDRLEARARAAALHQQFGAAATVYIRLADLARAYGENSRQRAAQHDAERMAWSAVDAKLGDTAVGIFTELAKMHGRRGERARQADILLNIATTWQDLGQPQAAATSFEKAGDEFAALGDIKSAARARVGLALAQVLTGELDAAERHLHDAIRDLAAIGAVGLHAYALCELGLVISHSAGRDAEMRDAFAAGRRLYAEIGDRAGEGFAQKTFAKALRRQGHFDDALRSYGDAKTIYADAGETLEAAAMAHAGGDMLWRVGRSVEALTWFEQAREIVAAIPDARREGIVWIDIGFAHSAAGHLDDAQAAFQAAGERLDETTEAGPLARVFSGIASVHERRLEYDAAVEALKRALAFREAVGNDEETAHGLIELGNSLLNADRPAEAVAVFERALALQAQRNDAVGQATVLANLAVAHKFARDFDAAETTILDALDRFKTARQGDAAARAVLTLGSIFSFRARTPEKEADDNEKLGKLAVSTLQVIRDIGDRAELGYALNRFAAMFSSIGETDRAMELVTEAIGIFDELANDDPGGAAFAKIILSRIHVAAKNYQAAADVQRELVEYFEKIGNRIEWARLLVHLGTSLHHLNRFDDAREAFARAIDSHRAHDDRDAWIDALIRLAHMEATAGNLQTALDRLHEALAITPTGAAWYDIACYYGRAATQRAEGFPPPETLMDMAFEALEKALDLGWEAGPHMDRDTDMDAFRSDPRYAPLRARLP